MAVEVSPLFLERYELKYHIPLYMVEPISAYVEAFCDMDYYSEIAPDKFYTINSLYLDSHDWIFLRKKEAGLPNRSSMRVRSYGHDPKPPYFIEVKKKKGSFTTKKRAKLGCENWSEELENFSAIEAADEGSRPNLEEIVALAEMYHVEPKVFTQYRRKAYISVVDDYARVTFDRDLRFCEPQGYSLYPREDLLKHYDHPDSFSDDQSLVVLELKSTAKVPLWMMDLIKTFNLVQASFSKYNNTIGDWYSDMPFLFNDKLPDIDTWATL